MEKYSEPQICVFNNKEIAEKLQTEYTVATGNLGIIKKIKYKDYEEHRYLNIKYDMVDNLHEYRVLLDNSFSNFLFQFFYDLLELK